MDVKEAVIIAKAHAADVFEDETIRIEEVWFDDSKAEWCVTIGLQRPEPAPGRDLIWGRQSAGTRTHYKTVRINDASKEIKSVRNHDKMPVSPT
jgi:hypothetical protein